MEKPIAKCPHCGSTNFYVYESTVYKAGTNEDSPHIIDCFYPEGGVDIIACAICDKNCSELILEPGIVFNF